LKKKSLRFTAFGAAIAVTLGATAPALAVAYSGGDIEFGDAANTYWEWETFSDGSMYGLWDDNWNDEGAFDYTYYTLYGSDDEANAEIDCSNGADKVDATDGSNAQIVTCIPVGIDNGDGEVTAQLEFRFFDDLKTMRTRIILTNETNTAIEGQVVEAYYDSYYDEETSVYASTTSGVDDYANNYDTVPTTVITPGDFRWVTDDRMENENSGSTGVAVGKAGSAVVPANNETRGFVSGGLGNGDDRNYTYFEVPTLQPGQTVEFVIMTQVWLFNYDGAAVAPMSDWQTAVGLINAEAWANTDITSDAFVYAGIADKSKVLNWTPAGLAETGTLAQTGTLAETRTLAETGTNITVPLGIAAVFLVVGVALATARRRTQS
jgi:hypothetical protein